MILILETNFILELVFQQEESVACEEILTLCDPAAGASSILVMPAFSLAEAGMTLERRQGERRQFVQRDVANHSREMGRAKTLARFATLLAQLRAELLDADRAEPMRFREFALNATEPIELIPLTERVITAAVADHLNGVVKNLPDAFVFASVRSFLTDIRPHDQDVYFVTRDAGIQRSGP